MSVDLRHYKQILPILLIGSLTATVMAQPGQDTPLDSPVTIYRSENLASGVYQWPSGKATPATQLLASGSTTHLQSLKISINTLKSGQALPDNYQDESENLIIIKEGRLSLSVADHRKELGPGSIALIQPGDRYTIKNTWNEPAAYYLLEYQSKASVDMARGGRAGGSLLVDWHQVPYQQHGKGGRRDFFDRPTAMCENFEMHVTNLNENTSSHDPHTHVVEEIILVIQGKISMHIDGQETEASVGDFAFIDSGVPHAPTNIGTGQAIYFAFQWK